MHTNSRTRSFRAEPSSSRARKQPSSHGDRVAHAGQGAVPEVARVRHDLGGRGRDGSARLRVGLRAIRRTRGAAARPQEAGQSGVGRAAGAAAAVVQRVRPQARARGLDALRGRARDARGMTWTDELRLLCVFTSGSCAAFSMAGDEETRFSLLLPGSKDKVATFEAWGGGLVALTEKMALVQVLDVDSVRPKVSLLPDCGLSDANPPTCMAVLEPKFLKSIYPEVLLGSSNRSLVVVGKVGDAHDMKLQDWIAAPISAVAIAWRSFRRTASSRSSRR
ncbi:hypothetical protein PR003_g20263 [Phytophthora rubi]|uniref:Vps16 N-terminal domain-containing protein n=1 Tax=Phytophthora rubi TaxID=129364 RepID=A0A6A4DS52_9STRA|nr:hypothetical protein PR003_g20263 [Phytophthora rubi]